MDKVIHISAMSFSNNSAGSKRIISYCSALSPLVDCIYLISMFSNIKEGEFEFKNIGKNIFSCNESLIEKRSTKFLFKFLSSFHKFYKSNSKCSIILYPSSFFIFDFIIIIYLFLNKATFYIELNEVRKFNLYFIRSNFFSKRVLYHNIKTFASKPFYMMLDSMFKPAKGHLYISSTIAKYYNKRNSIIIPIMCNNRSPKMKHLKKYNNSEVFKIGFAGTIDPYKEKMSTFFKSICDISKLHSNIQINLYGRITNENDLYSLLNKYGIKDLFFYNGIVNQKNLVEKLKKDNHLLILPRGFSKQNYYGFSTKLSDYLEAQLPILTSDVGDIGVYFVDNKNSFTYSPNNPKSLTQKLTFIIQNYNEISPQIINGGDSLVNNVFHYSNFSNSLYSFLFCEN